MNQLWQIYFWKPKRKSTYLSHSSITHLEACCEKIKFHIKYSFVQACANIVNPDQTLQNHVMLKYETHILLL